MSEPVGERVRRAVETAKLRKTETILRVLSLAFGLAALAFAGTLANYDVRNSRSDMTALSYIWPWVSFWPRLVNRMKLWSVSPLAVVVRSLWLWHAAVYIGSVVLSIVLAGSLNRSRLIWAVLSTLLPYLAPIVLAFLKRKPTPATIGMPGQMIVDLTVIALKMRPGALIEISSREEAGRFATRILNDELPGATLSSSSKLSIQQAPDSKSVSEVQKELSEIMQTEMGKAGLDPGAYNLRTIIAIDSANTYLCRAAIRRQPSPVPRCGSTTGVWGGQSPPGL